MASQQTSSTQASAFIIDVRKDYNDLTVVHFTAEEMLKFLNDGTIDIACKTHCLENTESKNLSANTIEYSISANYIEIVGVLYVSGTDTTALTQSTVNKVGEVSKHGFPEYWYEFNGKVGVFPPLTSVDGETATIYLAERPAVIESGDNVLIPTIYENALKFYMLGRMALKDKNFNMHKSMEDLYKKELGLYRKDLVEQATK